MPFPGPVPVAPNSGNPAAFNEDADIFLGWMNLFGNWLSDNLYPDMAVRPLTGGTAAAPVYSRDSDTNTGIFFPAADQVGITTGGVLRVTVTNTALVLAAGVAFQFSAGTAAAPVLAPTSDTNTGIFFPAADTVGVSAGGVLRVSIGGSNITSTVPLLAPSGTVLAPSMSFSGDTDTGFIRSAADTLGLVTGGVQRATLSTALLNLSVPASMSEGTAGAPSLYFGADSSTGFYRPEADNLNLAVAGVRKIQFDALKIVADIPYLAPNGTAALPSLGFSSDPDTGLYRSGVNSMSFSAGGAQRMQLTTALLDLSVPASLSAGTALLPSLYFGADSDTGLYSGGANVLGFATEGASRVLLSAAGLNVSVPINGNVAGSTTAPAFSFSSDPDTGMYQVSDDVLGFTAGGVMRMTLGASGVSFSSPIFSLVGSAAEPSFTFSGDSDTGFYRAGTNSIGIATSGVTAAVFTSTGNLRLFNTAGTFYTELSNQPTANRTLTMPDANVTLVSGTMVPTSLNLTAGNGLSGGGTLAANRSFAIDASVVATLANSQTFTGVKGFSSVARFSDGSAGTPSLGFINNTNTGIYRPTDDAIGFSTGGTERMRLTNIAISMSAPIHLGSGSAEDPVLSFTSDPDTGLFRAGTNMLGIATSGVTAAVFTATGNLRLFDTTGVFYTEISNQPTANRTLTLANGNTTLVSGTMVNTARSIATGNGLSGGGDLSANRTLSVDTAVVMTLNNTQTITAGKTFAGTANFEGFANFSTGTKAAPQIRFIADGDTGIFSPAANTLSVSVGGSENLRVGSANFHLGENQVANPASAATIGFTYAYATGTLAIGSDDTTAPTIYLGRPNNGRVMQFRNNGTAVGEIVVAASSTAYNTSSDYRLKRDLEDIPDAVERLMSLRPLRYKWVSAPRVSGEGFLAHELADQLPEAVSGVKDGVDEHGEPVYQGVDYSKAVPLLTAALQEALRKIAALEERLNVLEG